jgi:hypothetical protein
MRKMLWIAVLGLAGCSDLFSTKADMVATAAGHELSVEQLGDWLSRIKGLQINPDAAEFLATVWVDYTLFAQAIADGTLADDSAAVAEAMWPDVAEIKAERWYEELLLSREIITEAMADSTYGGDEIRIFQHILFSVAPSASQSVRDATRRDAQNVLNRARRGEEFALMALELSGDPTSRSEGGYLPPNPRGAYVAPFDSAGWGLAPGELSGLVYTPFGIHIIKRPARAEARQFLLDYLRETAQEGLDSLYLIELGEAKNLEVTTSATALIHQALDDERGRQNSRAALATFDGGEFTVAEFLRWMPALGPTASRMARSAPDDQLEQLTIQLTRNRLLLDQADSAGIALNELQWLGVRQGYEMSVDSLRLLLNLGPDVVDSTLSASQRTEMVHLKIDGYFSLVAAGRVGLLAPPSALPSVLRQGQSYDVNLAGVGRAALLAADYLRERGGGGASPLQPATGPAPVPGGTP